MSWGKEIKCEARNKFNKFNNTRAGMLDSIYHMALKVFSSHIFGLKCTICVTLKKLYLITFPENLQTTSGL